MGSCRSETTEMSEWRVVEVRDFLVLQMKTVVMFDQQVQSRTTFYTKGPRFLRKD